MAKRALRTHYLRSDMQRIIHHTAAMLLCLLVAIPGLAQKEGSGERNAPGKQYTIEQATSDRAQLHTIAFDGLAFLTGSFGADSFFPPGKVADFFGFQYMRDNDSNRLGHNTDFLTRIASNVLSILDREQLARLIALAREQEELYTEFARKRIVLLKGFRESLEQNKPLNKEAVIQYCRELYAIDGELSYRRAEVMGDVIRSFSQEQIAALDQLRFGNSASWPAIGEQLDKRSLSHRAHVGVMTYASELFSWYKGSVKADVYFCPERHGTYFGGFYLKDYPAMGNKGYSISTSLTGDAGKAFLDVLDPKQRRQVEKLPAMQRGNMEEIVRLREAVALSLRRFINGDKPAKTQVMERVLKYGEQDGELSFYYFTAFASINRSLTAAQREQLKNLRGLDIYPPGIYIYSDPEPMPEQVDCSFLFRAPSDTKKSF